MIGGIVIEMSGMLMLMSGNVTGGIEMNVGRSIELIEIWLGRLNDGKLIVMSGTLTTGAKNSGRITGSGTIEAPPGDCGGLPRRSSSSSPMAVSPEPSSSGHCPT